jgi:pyruvate formate lyase activating enzyme
LGGTENLVPIEDVYAHLEKRRNVLGGVVLSGGEATIAPHLRDVIKRIRGIGLAVKLDTNGMRSDVVRSLVNDRDARPDFIALDVKLPPERYGEITGEHGISAADAIQNIKASIEIVKQGALLGIDYEFRTLALPPHFFTSDDLKQIRKITGCDAGDEHLKVRPFVPGNCLDASWNNYEANRRPESTTLP